MRFLVAVLFVLFSFSWGLDNSHILSAVNVPGSTWKAGVNERFVGKDLQYVKRQLGALKTPKHLRLPEKPIDALRNLPEHFDPREQWGRICPSLYEVRDQSNCGSCWAFGAVEAATDRICIQTNGTTKVHLSATDLLSCCISCGMGCNGGYPSAAWSYLKNKGVVTGGNYGDYSYCSSYPFPMCDHHVEDGKYGPCEGDGYPTPKCPTACDANSTYPVPFAQDKHHFKSAYSVPSAQEKIMTELMTNGPLEAAISVYEDFLSYKSGVYQHVTGRYLGGHAIKLMGWGVEDGTPYWLLTNSWNEQWGEGGFFKILRGSNHCGVESQIVGGMFA